MASWEPLRRRLADEPGAVTLAWSEIEALVGDLPPSAYRYDAFWSGDRSGWPGFRTTDVRVHESVTFVRHTKSVTGVSRPARQRRKHPSWAKQTLCSSGA